MMRAFKRTGARAAILPLILATLCHVASPSAADETSKPSEGAGQPSLPLPKGFIAPRIPRDIPGGAQKATHRRAAVFAWKEFIALNWPAVAGRRDRPARKLRLDSTPGAPRVWETFRGRVEVYPGFGAPFSSPARNYGYDAPPRYVFDPEKVGRHKGIPEGEVPPCSGTPSKKTPWHSLDEANHNNVRAGLSPAGPFPNQQILLESKVNREEYVYVASRGWYGERSVRGARRRTGRYVRTHLRAPPPPKRIDDPDDLEYLSLPNHTIEIKTAWRRLGPHDDRSRFFTRQVRYYDKTSDGQICYVDSSADADGEDRWGLLAFHVMQKTPSAPYFIWATFEQVDVLVRPELGPDGKPVPVETAAGALTKAGKEVEHPFSPSVRVIPATQTQAQQYVPESMTPPITPQHQLYYHQEAAFDIPEVKYVGVNRRMYPIAKPVLEVNAAAQRKLAESAPKSPLRYYRLVAVQWIPLHKEAGQVYEGPADPSTYYAANVIIEAPPVAQSFSGQFSHGTSKTTDFLHTELVFLNPSPNPGDPLFLNTFFGGRGFTAGGCMGCHGTRQAYGTDWSFLLDRQRVTAPDEKLYSANEPAAPEGTGSP